MDFKYTVIGAGVVGLAIARALSEAGNDGGDLLVVEKEKTFGCGISSRNSEVIHSGIYYREGSLKQRLCVRGRKLLYDYCARRDIPHNKCGKLIIATCPEEEPELEWLRIQAGKNGVENVELLDKNESLKLEPHINVTASLYLKETGIVDGHSLMKAMAYDVKQNGGSLLYNAPVVSLRRNGLYVLELGDGSRFSSECVINAAGLHATAMAGMMGIPVPSIHPCKGSYFSYTGKLRCGHLVYPVPEKKLTGLGVHATIDMGGRIRFGPDTEYIGGIDDFSVTDSKKDYFYRSAKKIFPAIIPDELHPDTAGIRPKLQGPDDSEVKDFYIRNEADKGFPRLVNLIGIESPGLTSSMAIGEYVRELVRRNP
ncbi:MAG TPA: NAD(P)/FAD-dependent oxidoreductase [Spirochaetota bacterium]|nr:NAD(P)/FAD-dependent oxidoreductase [Spirochaetota bacterium]HPC41958.1 NAD(P)/FAD-dependent oxidoreductase [Spirochaetota bacterium]HPL17008.1 NAD(P)/FAD-dependent oxidoreductase [Spirochaetota bacterium]HQF06996.1 NAD(P)/FAD-dependent oxidoreductase [Spirochaetota bacterium]HQH95733.1 NAD(P)/FAD-dependent oxidoreductase [Spirochaetota bacterium]